jgi:hypothetical protein
LPSGSTCRKAEKFQTSMYEKVNNDFLSVTFFLLLKLSYVLINSWNLGHDFLIELMIRIKIKKFVDNPEGAL